jgi:hypothetical protein
MIEKWRKTRNACFDVDIIEAKVTTPRNSCVRLPVKMAAVAWKLR